jgi:hypothetical protein
MRRVLVLALGLAAGCGGATPTGEKPPPASQMFDKTDKDVRPNPKGKDKKSDFG